MKVIVLLWVVNARCILALCLCPSQEQQPPWCTPLLFPVTFLTPGISSSLEGLPEKKKKIKPFSSCCPAKRALSTGVWRVGSESLWHRPAHKYQNRASHVQPPVTYFRRGSVWGSCQQRVAAPCAKIWPNAESRQNQPMCLIIQWAFLHIQYPPGRIPQLGLPCGMFISCSSAQVLVFYGAVPNQGPALLLTATAFFF